MKRQILSVFLTSLLIAACGGRTCTSQIGVGRTAVVTASDGSQTIVTADENGEITRDCTSTVTVV